MSVSRTALVDAIQSTYHLWDQAAPVFTPLGVAGVRGQIGPTSYPPLNVVGMARLDEADADRAIGEVIDRFASESKAFAWLVGPDSTPTDLEGRLQAAGLIEAATFAGMALTDLDHEVPPSPAVHVEEATFEQMRQAADMMATAFGFAGMTAADAAAWVDAFEALQDRYRSRWYLAFADPHEDPVGFSFMTDTDVPGLLYFPGAATLEAHRGRGIYRSFVARRIADARAQGAQAAVTQAVRDTSAPILERLGFTELCSLVAYAWLPQEA